MKKKVLEYHDIEFIQWVLENVTNVGAFDNERTLYNVDALKYKLIAIRAQMEYEKSNQSK